MSKIEVDNLHFYPLIKDDESGVAYGAGEFKTQSITANFVVRKYDRVWKETIDSDDTEKNVGSTIAAWFGGMGIGE